mmetsp:Transcript_13689/g.33487  ORF Transcript_13689/g.33487 Transcript_13689/m.33487 type:complete len:96 (+) Transcript_13689:223-510(+)|eukprot:CAMPEP_0114507070 /NCGR_PEP_ID=MMETSP0109-20121206/11803_1 /TAXON_ID=29199 /ORGANISM="Chlorarachnion reptans, Strain CCCM449" /LENGTH=95 /DNA_ID=CAMNT_0001685777 /DNA_START=101 /DNA_END=388 /DNA_ORIENTATION=+
MAFQLSCHQGAKQVCIYFYSGSIRRTIWLSRYCCREKIPPGEDVTEDLKEEEEEEVVEEISGVEDEDEDAADKIYQIDEKLCETVLAIDKLKGAN